MRSIHQLKNLTPRYPPPVIPRKNSHPDGSPFATGAPGRQIHPALGRRPGEAIVEKEHPDAFQGSSLGRVLGEQGIGAVVVCGFASEACVDTTVRSAYGRGLSVELAGDAHSTTDGGALDAEQVIAHENHVLARFAAILATVDIRFEISAAPSDARAP